METWDWLVHSDAGLAVRIGVGVLIFAGLATVDYVRKGERATRWREYSVLIIAVVVAMAFGAVNDLVTSSISWEYFYYGKGLADRLARVPPDPVELHRAAAMVGVKATWSAGLIIGVALLIANNPSRRREQLGHRSLIRYMPLVLACVVIGGVAGGIAGYAGIPTRWSRDFAEMLQRDEMRPRRFMAAYGIHLGDYIGGATGAVMAVVSIRRGRRAVSATA